jgi:hypothetical protein
MEMMRHLMAITILVVGPTAFAVWNQFSTHSEIKAVALGSLDDYQGCGMSGSVTSETDSKYWLNQRKNRYLAPDFAPFVTMKTLLSTKSNGKPGGLNDDSGVTIEGYVGEVKKGGGESTNCSSKATLTGKNTDEHIYLFRTLAEAKRFKKTRDKTNAVVVETTPRVKELAARNGFNWYLPALKGIELKKVRVKGWLLRDDEHVENSYVDGARGGSKEVHRGTIWEVHPVTSITILN